MVAFLVLLPPGHSQEMRNAFQCLPSTLRWVVEKFLGKKIGSYIVIEPLSWKWGVNRWGSSCLGCCCFGNLHKDHQSTVWVAWMCFHDVVKILGSWTTLSNQSLMMEMFCIYHITAAARLRVIIKWVLEMWQMRLRDWIFNLKYFKIKESRAASGCSVVARPYSLSVARVPSLPHYSWVTLGKLLHHFEPQFSHQ